MKERREGTTEDVMVAWYHRLDGREFGHDPRVGDGQGGLVFCYPCVHRVRHD